MKPLIGLIIIKWLIGLIIIFVLYVVVILIKDWIRSIRQKDKVEVYKRKVKKAERRKGAPLTKDEKEIIAREVDEIDVPSSATHIDLNSVDWRFDVDDEDVTYRKEETEQ
jgi:predicted Holliday junction resolvase-like endonuclease